jgi:hypothetical protein
MNGSKERGIALPRGRYRTTLIATNEATVESDLAPVPEDPVALSHGASSNDLH